MKRNPVPLVILVAASLLLCRCVSSIHEQGIVLDRYRKVLLVGETETMHASIASEESLAWHSSDESVLTVAQTGDMTGISPGNAVVTVKTADGTFETYCYATVLAKIPENVILCIGDGMGFEHVKAAGMFKNGSEGTLCFEALAYENDMTTSSADSRVTDSAASGTAMATGRKVNNGTVSVALPGDGSELETLVELFKEKGKRTGLVTTTHLTNATPAAFGAHEQSRHNYDAIAFDYVNGSTPNVLFGGGGKGITAEMTSTAGYHTVTDSTGFFALEPASYHYYSAQFGMDNMPYMYDYPEPGTYPYPELAEMTDTALSILELDPDGFFLMVEGGRIDHAGHANNIENTVYETVEFEDAVNRVLEWMTTNQAVLIVTADHETGGLKVLANNGVGEMPDVSWITDYHTGVEVPVYVSGCNQNIVFGEFDNTHIYDVIADLYE
jgi:alkaline phosphatase